MTRPVEQPRRGPALPRWCSNFQTQHLAQPVLVVPPDASLEPPPNCSAGWPRQLRLHRQAAPRRESDVSIRHTAAANSRLAGLLTAVDLSLRLAVEWRETLLHPPDPTTSSRLQSFPGRNGELRQSAAQTFPPADFRCRHHRKYPGRAIDPQKIDRHDFDRAGRACLETIPAPPKTFCPEVDRQ